MRIVLILISILSLQASASAAGIINWKETQGISEQEAIASALNAISDELLYSDEGESCGVDEIWGLEREQDIVAQFPEKRGPIFALSAYVKGPHVDMGCSGTSKYDCRVVFSKPPRVNVWGVEYTECEPVK